MPWRTGVLFLTPLLLLACYASTLQGMAGQWWTDEDMSHGFLVPIVILWVVWRERERWRALPRDPCWWGFALLIPAACLQFVGALGVGLFADSLAFLLSVAGALVCLGGVDWLRTAAFPFVLGLFMLPKLAIVYNQATLPLQLLASRIASGILTSAGIGVIREGNILDVGGHRVAVAEACNGIRYLLSLGFTALVVGYLADSKPVSRTVSRTWMRAVLVAVAVPVAIFANGARVAAAGWLPWLDAGVPHAVSGWFLFVICAAALVLIRQLFNKVQAHDQP